MTEAAGQRVRLRHPVTGGELVYRNGILMAPGLDYGYAAGGFEVVFGPGQRIGAGEVLQVVH